MTLHASKSLINQTVACYIFPRYQWTYSRVCRDVFVSNISTNLYAPSSVARLRLRLENNDMQGPLDSAQHVLGLFTLHIYSTVRFVHAHKSAQASTLCGWKCICCLLLSEHNVLCHCYSLEFSAC